MTKEQDRAAGQAAQGGAGDRSDTTGARPATCDFAICRSTGECRGYPWRCHRSLAQVGT